MLSERNAHIGSSQSTWRRPAGLLGKLEKRPGLDVVRLEKPELSRGMKVRSSVKKLCDGCKVGHLDAFGELGRFGWS